MAFPPAPSTLDYCVLFGRISSASGNVVSGATVRVEPSPRAEFVSADVAKIAASVSKQVVEVVTDVNGEFFVELRRGMDVRIVVAEIELDVAARVPYADSVDLAHIAMVPTPFGVLNTVV